MQISVKTDVKELQRKLNHAKKQIPFAVKGGLDATAFDVQRAVKQALPNALDNPIKYTISGVQVKKAEKNNLIATVGFAGKGFGRSSGSIPQADYMHFMIKGGIRTPRKTSIAVPNPRSGKKVTNKAGNIPRGKIKKLLSDKDKYFSGAPHQWSKAKEGIWERMPANSKRKKNRTQKLRMPIAWEPTTQYKKGYFKFEKIVGRTVAKTFRNNFDKAIAKALKTAR
jgi:hypothetical protein